MLLGNIWDCARDSVPAIVNKDNTKIPAIGNERNLCTTLTILQLLLTLFLTDMVKCYSL
jgi:hypothetical protein